MLKLEFVSLVIVSFLSLSQAYLENDGWLNIELSHALNAEDPEHFTYRGNVTISSLNSGMSNAIQEVLSGEQVRQMKMLAKNKQFYRLKATVSYINGMKRSYLTSTSACGLMLAQLNDVLWISIDASGFVTSINETPAIGNMDGNDCSSLELMTMDEFNTDVLIKHTELAPVPDTASFIQKVEREREARERGETRDNRTFFAKYWMYIVPAFLLILISGATGPEPSK